MNNSNSDAILTKKKNNNYNTHPFRKLYMIKSEKSSSLVVFRYFFSHFLKKIIYMISYISSCKNKKMSHVSHFVQTMKVKVSKVIWTTC